MDFTKFVSMISHSSLFFCRADLFKDPFEGSYSKANVALRPQVYKNIQSEQFEKMIKHHSKFSKWIRKWTYINCWHNNEYESAAMWDLYAKMDSAIAIESRYQKLKSVLPEKAYLGLVRYIDYESEWIPEGNSFYPFMHKRKSFEHEKEIRSVIQDLPTSDKGIEIGKHNGLTGISIPVALNDLITGIYVAPTAQAWFADLVAEVSVKYNVSAPVKKSNLYSEPVF